MEACHFGTDIGHCETMICARTPKGEVLRLSLDCAGSIKISTALAHFAMPEFFKSEGIPHNPSECILIGAALAGYEMLVNLPALTPRDLQKQEFELLLEEIFTQQQKSVFAATQFNQVFRVPVPCNPEELSEEMREALLRKACALTGWNDAHVTLNKADFSPVYQYFKMPPTAWHDECHNGLSYRQLMKMFISQLLRNMRIYNENIPACALDSGPEYRFMLGCPAQSSYLSEENRENYTQLFRDAAAYHHFSVELYPEPMAALLSALAQKKAAGQPLPLDEGLLVDDHGSLTDDHCCIVARRDENGALEYCRVKDASDRVGGHLIESGMLLRALGNEGLKTSDLRPGDRAFALQKLRSWKEEYCLGAIPAAFDTRTLSVRLKDGTRRAIRCSVEDLVWATVYQTPVEQDKTWQQLTADYKKSVWLKLQNYNLPCRHVLLTGGVSNMPAARHAARHTYEGADIRVEEEPSLSVADGLCRALSRNETDAFCRQFTPDLFLPNDPKAKNATPELHETLVSVLLPHLSRILMRVLLALEKAGKTCTFAGFEQKVLQISQQDQSLQNDLRATLLLHAMTLFGAARDKAVAMLPESFPASLPDISLPATFPQEINALCNPDTIVKKVVGALLYQFFFPSLGLGKRRQAALTRCVLSGNKLSFFIRRALEQMQFAQKADAQLLNAFLPYIAKRVTYAHFDIDQ